MVEKKHVLCTYVCLTVVVPDVQRRTTWNNNGATAITLCVCSQDRVLSTYKETFAFGDVLSQQHLLEKL